MARTVVEDEADRLLLAIDGQPPAPGEVRRGFVAARISEEDLPPAPGGDHVTDVERAVGAEPLEEHARLDVAFRARRENVEGDLAEPLVLFRERDDHHVRRRRRRNGREARHRPQHAEDADAARLHRHELAVRREAAQAEQQAQQHRHRDREAQRLRKERRQHARHRRPSDALRDQLLALLKDRRDLEDEGEDHQAQEEGEQHLTNEVAIEDLEHARLTGTSLPVWVPE